MCVPIGDADALSKTKVRRENVNTDRSLIERAQAGDADALSEMTARHDALVKFVVKRFQGRGAEAEDLWQIGRVGLIKAIRNFDLAYDVKFSTYAVPIVMGEIRRFLRDDGQIHVSRTVRENGMRIQKYVQGLDYSPNVDEIARALQMKNDDVVLAMESGRRVRSLEESVSADGTLLLRDTLGADTQDEMVDRLDLNRLLSVLSEKDRSLIVRRYFLEQTQTRIASEIGMTQVQVSRLESRILKRLRAYVSEDGGAKQTTV